MTRKSLKSAKSLIGRITRIRAKAKAGYRQAEDLFARLKTVLPVGQPLRLECGRAFRIVDKFAEKTTAFKMVGFDRFDLEELKS